MSNKNHILLVEDELPIVELAISARIGDSGGRDVNGHDRAKIVGSNRPGGQKAQTQEARGKRAY